MIPAINDQATLPAPPTLESVAIVDADFVNGIYDGDGISTFSDLTSYTSDYIYPGIGLVSFQFFYDYDTDTSSDGLSVPLIGSFLAKLLTGNFTYAIEFYAANNEFADLVRVSTSIALDSTLALEVPINNYVLLYDSINPAGDPPLIDRDVTIDDQEPDSVPPGIHAMAFTRTDGRLVLSIDGGAVIRNEDDSYPFSDADPAFTNAWIAGDNTSYGQVVFGRIRIFDSLDDSFLPGLSLPTVLSSPVNDDIANATVINVGETLTGHNFCATREMGEPAHALVGNNAFATVWWKLELGLTGDVTFDLDGSEELAGWGFAIAIYTSSGGPDVTLLTEVASASDPWPYPAVTFSGVSGTTYYIAISGQFGGLGMINLNCSM